MTPMLDQRAHEASDALRAAAELRRPGTATPRRSRPMLRVVLATSAVVIAVVVGALIAVRGPSRVPAGRSNTSQTYLTIEFRAAVRAAPYHVYAPTSPDLMLSNVGSERGKDAAGHEVYTIDLWYRAAHGTFHVWMVERSYATSIIGDLATVGQPTNVAGTIWHLQTLPMHGLPRLQLARGTNDGAVIEVDGNFDLHTMSSLTASLR